MRAPPLGSRLKTLGPLEGHWNWAIHRTQFPSFWMSVVLITLASFLVQSVTLEPALGFTPRFNIWSYIFVALGFLILPLINCIAVQMALFLSISMISALGFAEPLTGSHAAGTSPVIFGLSFYTATLAYHAARGDLAKSAHQRVAIYGSAIFLYTGPILAYVRPVRIDVRRANVAMSYVLLGFFMFWIVAKNLVPLLALRDFTSFWDVIVFGVIFEIFVYFNFAGLSLMIYGVAQLCGLRVPLNFRQPFSARNVVEFWRAWHITLAMVLKEVFYLRIKRVASTDVAIVGVFLASALWHGVTLNFLVWGLFHGLMFVVAKYVLKRGWLVAAFLMLPPVLILGRALFAENRPGLLMDKIASVLTLDGITALPLSTLSLIIEERLATLSLMLGGIFILLEAFDGRRRVFARRRYSMFRSRAAILMMIVLIFLLGRAGGGEVYAVYGQR